MNLAHRLSLETNWLSGKKENNVKTTKNLKNKDCKISSFHGLLTGKNSEEIIQPGEFNYG